MNGAGVHQRDRIDAHVGSKEIYEWIYRTTIQPAVSAIDRNDLETAYRLYRRMVLDLKVKFNVD